MGNLIALPLNGKSVEDGNSCFVNQGTFEGSFNAGLCSLCKKTLQNQKCFFWRYFYFSQFTDAQASPHLQKVKISS